MYLFIVFSGLLFFYSTKVSAGVFGDTCNSNPYYDPLTWQYNDACQNIYLFCDPASNKCNYIGCTNTDYVKGWNTNIRPFPARCGNGTFCPDNLSHCTNTLPTGAACEMQRDDECQGINSICLNGFCNVKAVPLGGKCGNDTTQYVSYDAEGYAELQTIVRDNCTDGTYCINEACVKAKDNGAACEQDRECNSETCGSDGYCIMGPDVFHAIATWLWGVLGAAVVIFMIIILLLLWALQRYQSKKEKLKVRKFFGDNEEFAKYAMLDDDSLYDDTAQLQPPASLNEKNRASMVYLTTPDYSKSSALSVSGHHHGASTPKLPYSNSPKGSGVFSRNSGSFPNIHRERSPEPPNA
ncbi:unnamed protein product [Cunninghamella echinulata]